VWSPQRPVLIVLQPQLTPTRHPGAPLPPQLRVGVCGPLCPEWVLADLACALYAHTLVALPHPLRAAEDLA
jgi:long-subunit acyl-CoA synthetase (AMP-forming)